jgi:hypothetical protein
MVVQCPVRRLGIVRRDRSCMLEQWVTIHRSSSASALLSLSISIALPRYPHPWSFSITPFGIGIPSLLASASYLPRYRHPALSTLPSLVSVSLALWHHWYPALVSLSFLRTPSPNSASVSSSTGFVSSLPPYNPVSPLFLHTNQPPYRNTQTFPAEQSSLQLYTATFRVSQSIGLYIWI